MNIIIIGAGGHAKTVIDIIGVNSEFNIIGLLDDNKGIHGKYVLGKKVLGRIDSIREYDPVNINFVLSIGNNQVRGKLFNHIIEWGYTPVNVISQYAVISRHAKLGKGLVINAGVGIHPDVNIDDNVIIGMNATISHDSIIERDVHISPGVHITGSVHIGMGVDIGAGAVIIPGVKVGKNSKIGAGAVVTNNIERSSVAVGIPARTIRSS